MSRAPAKSVAVSKPYEIEFCDLSGLKPYARNARLHAPSQISEVAASIRARGWTNPILVDENGGILAGHGRRLAAMSIYAAGEVIKLPSGGELSPGQVPVIVARGWSEAEKRAYILHDNQSALNGASWDANLLNFELASLEDIGFDLNLTGFGQETMPEAGAKTKAPVVREVLETGPLEARFWISLRGPLQEQARVLDAVKKALGAPGEVEIDIGTMC